MTVNTRYILCAIAFLYITACSTAPTTPSKPVNIYDAITNDEVHYRDEADKSISEQEKELVAQQVSEIRNLFFRKSFDEAQNKAERLVRVNPNFPESYYWLARIYLQQGDYQQGYNMATKGVSLAEDPSLKRELERIQRQAQMGNY